MTETSTSYKDRGLIEIGAAGGRKQLFEGIGGPKSSVFRIGRPSFCSGHVNDSEIGSIVHGCPNENLSLWQGQPGTIYFAAPPPQLA